MNTKWLSLLLVVIGIGIGQSLSGLLTWAEIEANLGVSSESKSLDISCPLMLSYTETGAVIAQIVNETADEVKPVVTAAFGQPNTIKQEVISQAYTLAPRETQSVQWQVDSSNAVFGRIIPVIVKQSPYSINPSRSSACGIVLFSLFGWNGSKSLIATIAISIFCLAAGFFLIYVSPTPQIDSARNMGQMRAMLCILTLAALTSSLLRWWGLTIFIEAISAITVGTALTELLIPSHGSER